MTGRTVLQRSIDDWNWSVRLVNDDGTHARSIGRIRKQDLAGGVWHYSCWDAAGMRLARYCPTLADARAEIESRQP